VNRIFDALLGAVHERRGSVVAFAGDAMTCWFGDDDGRAAIACGLAMQGAMTTAGSVTVGGEQRAVGLKVTVVAGEARRFVVGDARTQCLDVLAGALVDRLAAGEQQARAGDVLVHARTAEALGDALQHRGERDAFVIVEALRDAPPARAWPPPPRVLADEEVKPWVLAPVYAAARSGHSAYLAEFRSVVALFGSFEGIDYDAADAGERLAAVARGILEIVTRHGGFVFDMNTGDKGSYFLAVFGAPQAHGDDVRRAASAADELRKAGVSRIGVNAGRVYAGLYEGADRSVYRVAGDAVNLAARLMTTAVRNQILMSGDVGAALDRRFEIRALDAVTVKGRATPVAVCELLGPAAAGVRLSEPRYALPIVGRAAELAVIDRSIENAKEGHGGVLALCADAGMGKSRLVNQAIQRATASGFECVAGECQPHGTGIAYLPWQPVLNALLGIPTDAPLDARREALLAVLRAAAPQAAAVAPLLDRALDLPMPDNDVTRGMPAPVRKQVLEQVLTGVVRGRAAMGPLCIVLEDVHWADSLSRDLLQAIAATIRDVPVLVVIAHRPLEAPLRLPHTREVQLAELTADEASRLASMLMEHVMHADAPPDTVALITARANGNPFYLEELVRYVAEHGATTELPASLETLILSRIDSLSTVQQLTVKVASVIGRRFPTEWLTGAFGATGVSTEAADLERIRSLGLVVSDTPPPHEAYLFRHAVVRDVAYETIAFGLRQSLHEQLAQYLEKTSADAPPVDLLAYHYARSPNEGKEALYRRMAAELAIRNGAYADALAHVERASEIVARSMAPDRLEQELELQLLLGTILLVVDGQGSAKAKAVYDRARELSRAVPPGPAVGRAIFGLWTYYLFQGLMGPTEELADEALALAQMAPDPGVRVMAHLAVAQTHMWTGKWRKCHEHYEHVLTHYDPAQHQAYITHYAQNPRFTAADSGFWALWAMGLPDSSHVVAETAIADAAPLNHDFTYVIAYLCRPVLAYLTRRHDVLGESVGEFIERSQRAGNPFYIAMALALKAYHDVLRGEHDAGIALLAEQDATMRALGSKLIEPFVTSLLLESYLVAGRYDDGLAMLDARFDTFVAEGRVAWVPDHLRLRAELR
ncbi:MAG TPA: AAA family ATPase, partial [Gemmatimonadaceae bacterium]|nr:AAA family ATPase [Gemmatimonadaceae bacterium]